ncbi:MAG TPA: hypothetical protein VFC39_12490 [Acidobacteriaceae bacterium]|nr:hypothetical protein [Acidobacteriaceae bacterium]
MAPSSDLFKTEPLTSKSYDPEPLREAIRGAVTIVASVAFFIIIGVYLYEAGRATDTTWLRIKEAMQSILPAVTTVLGAALGFYFGSQKR